MFNSKWHNIGTIYKELRATYSYKVETAWDATDIKINLPFDGLYVFTLSAFPSCDDDPGVITLGVDEFKNEYSQSSFSLSYGKGFNPACIHTFLMYAKAGTCSLGIWSNRNRTITNACITAIRLL